MCNSFVWDNKTRARSALSSYSCAGAKDTCWSSSYIVGVTAGKVTGLVEVTVHSIEDPMNASVQFAATHLRLQLPKAVVDRNPIGWA